MDELAKVMLALSEQVQKSFVGGGSDSQSNPYTEAEYDSMLASGTWNGGFVENWDMFQVMAILLLRGIAF